MEKEREKDEGDERLIKCVREREREGDREKREGGEKSK